ncbi:MAG: HAD family hydrolase [Thermodesulfobacteriota bacterium]
MTRTRVLIYDCDGVLFDSRDSNRAFYDHILARFGLPPMRPEQLSFVHASTAEEAIDFLFRDHPKRLEAQAYRLSMDYRPFVPLMRPEPHVREVLARVRPRYRTAIATNRGLTMPLVIREHRLEGLFDLTVTSLDVREPKPHPECLLKILSHFELEPDEAIYIGDSEVDRLVAERASVPFVAYKNPGLAARHHIRDHLEILRILDNGSAIPGGGSDSQVTRPNPRAKAL